MDIKELHAWMDKRFDRLEAKVDTTNGRVSMLERWRSGLTGAMRALIAVAAIPSLVLTVALILERQ